MNKNTRPCAKDLAEMCVALCDEKQAENIVALEVGELTTIAEYFVMCTANSEPHLRAICNNLERRMLELLRVKPLTVDGTAASEWILIDFGDVLVHVMTPNSRAKYQLESLWGDAPKLEAVRTLEKMISDRQSNI